MYRLLDKGFRILEFSLIVKVKGEDVWVRFKISNELKNIPIRFSPYFIEKCRKNPDKRLEKIIEMLQRQYKRYLIDLEEIEMNAVKHFPKPDRHIYIVIKKKELEK